jgi:hypothetical protein
MRALSLALVLLVVLVATARSDPPPCAPTTRVQPPGEDLAIDLQWVVDPGETATRLIGFELWRKVDKEPWVLYKTPGAEERAYEDVDIQVGHTYTWDLKSQMRDTMGQIVTSTHALHGEPPPCVHVAEVPSNLTVAPTCAPHTLRLAWKSAGRNRQIRIEQPRTGTKGSRSAPATACAIPTRPSGRAMSALSLSSKPWCRFPPPPSPLQVSSYPGYGPAGRVPPASSAGTPGRRGHTDTTGL